VYSQVADKVRAAVAADAERHHPEALLLRHEVDRKLVKQTVMTSVYGVTQMGARDQIHHRCVPQRACAAWPQAWPRRGGAWVTWAVGDLGGGGSSDEARRAG